MSKLLLFCSLLLLMTARGYSQSRTVTGTVTDGKNNALIGASISVKGTKAVATTNVSGGYSINVPNENAILIVSYIGFDTKEVKIGKESVLNIQLSAQSQTLSEIVVTGYQTQKKADLTGAVSVVDVKELKKVPNNNPIQALQGRVPGMIVYTDGSPSGSNVGILIRGISSINGTAPLYVIDGVATTAGMHELNPNDIESIQVLKDASSASIYGSRAASGVIIITTKKAKKGELTIDADARQSYSYYNSKLSVLDAEGYGKAVWQASANNAIAYGGSPLSSYLVYNFDWTKNANGLYTLNKINIPQYIDPAKTMLSSNTDWFKAITQTGVSRNYDISIANGTEKGSTVFSMDYTDNQGIVKTTDFKRISMRLNTTYKLIDNRLLVGENFTANTTQEVQGNTLNAALQALPIIPIHTVDGIGWGGPYGGMNDRQNPVRLLDDNQQNHYNYLRLFGNGFADLEIINGLHVKTSLGLDYGNFIERNMQLAYVSGYLNNPINQVTMTNWYTAKLTWTNTIDYMEILMNVTTPFRRKLTTHSGRN